jgi:hypothetical protein
MGEWTYTSTHSLTSALGPYGDERLAALLGCFTPGEKGTGTFYLKGWSVHVNWVNPAATLRHNKKCYFPGSVVEEAVGKCIV